MKITENNINKGENTLGTIVLSEENFQTDNSKVLSVEKDNDKQKEIINDDNDELTDLTPEEHLQLALSQMMKKNYQKSKKILEKFIIDHTTNPLAGSAHYWLGKIYLFEENYRKAAIIFGEGVQKFPESIKAAEMYYELAKSLKEMQKNTEACKTLTLLETQYKGNKYAKDPENIKDQLKC